MLTEDEVEAMLDRLTALGIVEETAGHVRTTRAWNGRLQGAAEKLNLEIARTGRTPAGNPLQLAVERAIADAALPFEGRDLDVAVHVLVLLEASVMTPNERLKLGLGRMRLPGD